MQNRSKWLIALCASLTFASAGCQAPEPTAGPGKASPSPSQANDPGVSAPQDEVLATIHGRVIRQSRLVEPLIESYGLNMLMQTVQYEMVLDQLKLNNLELTPQDVEREFELTMGQMFPDIDDLISAPGETLSSEEYQSRRMKKYEELLGEVLKVQQLSKPEFELVMKTNAGLRKLSAPKVAGKVSEQDVREAFNSVYGERAKVRHIALSNQAQIAEARRRLDAGEAFEQVARDMSQAQVSAAQGGLVPPFSRSTVLLDRAFVDVAFSLEPGEVSSPVQANEMFHLIKLEEKIPPSVAKFEDYQDSLREKLEINLVQEEMTRLRNEFGQEAIKAVKIEHPILKQQFDERVAQANQQRITREEALRQLERERSKRENASPAPETTVP